MKAQWTQILVIWALALIGTVVLVTQFEHDYGFIKASFGSILAGSIATVSMLQLFENKADGFVRKLAYVSGGTYFILAVATGYLFIKG